MAKIQPAPKKLYFNMPAGKNVAYIDLNLGKSVTNRRFYRQGENLAISNVKVMTFNTEATTVGVLTCQDSWMVSNAWTKAFKAWQKMQYEYALDEQPSIKPKYNDFKIFMDSQMYDEWKANVDGGGNGFQANNQDPTGILMPANFYGIGITDIYQPGEWIYSKFTAPQIGGAAIVDYYMTMHGADVPGTSVGLVHNYQLSRSVPQSPDPQTGLAGDNIFTALFDEGTVQSSEVLADMLVDNDEVPYDLDEYPGGATNAAGAELVMYDGFSATNNSGVLQQINTGPFNAQCGLLKFVRTGNTDYSLVIEVTLMPGHERGYLAQPMQDV